MPSLPTTFRRPGQLGPEEGTKAYDNRRGSAASRGYNHRWAKAADGHRCRYPLCVGCEAAGLVVAAELVDHVEPHKGDTHKFWDRTMWQSSCKWHHDVVKQKLEIMWLQGRIGVADLRLDSAVALRLAASLRA